MLRDFYQIQNELEKKKKKKKKKTVHVVDSALTAALFVFAVSTVRVPVTTGALRNASSVVAFELIRPAAKLCRSQNTDRLSVHKSENLTKYLKYSMRLPKMILWKKKSWSRLKGKITWKDTPVAAIFRINKWSMKKIVNLKKFALLYSINWIFKILFWKMMKNIEQNSKVDVYMFLSTIYWIWQRWLKNEVCRKKSHVKDGCIVPVYWISERRFCNRMKYIEQKLQVDVYLLIQCLLQYMVKVKAEEAKYSLKKKKQLTVLYYFFNLLWHAANGRWVEQTKKPNSTVIDDRNAADYALSRTSSSCLMSNTHICLITGEPPRLRKKKNWSVYILD